MARHSVWARTYPSLYHVSAGGLLSYGTDLIDGVTLLPASAVHSRADVAKGSGHFAFVPSRRTFRGPPDPPDRDCQVG
jgi:hypothetical protein